MEIHHYDRVTGEYLKAGTARQDPLDRGRYLIPAHATDIQPPATAANEAAVFTGGAWVKTPDFRGTSYWIADGTEQEIGELGEKVPSGATTTPPPGPGKIWDGSAWVDDPDYAAAQQAAKRAGASLSPEEFLVRASDLGLITKDTAEEASDGTWPAEFNPLLAGLSRDERIRAKAKWARSQDVRRDDPLLDKVAKTKIRRKAEREAALDRLFGI